MQSDRKPLYIIGSIVILAIVAIIGYVVYQKGGNPAMDMGHETSQEDKKQTSSDAVQTDEVTISGYAFSPAVITVKAGTKVTWTNKDSVAHTVTSDSDAPAKVDSGLFGKDKSFSFTFDTAGTYNYYCEPHPYMKGTVIVTE